MSYESFIDFDLWQKAADLTESIFSISRGIEDASLRTQLTSAAVLVPFHLGEAAVRDDNEAMTRDMEKAEAPLNQMRGLLNECRQHGYAPGTDYEQLDERCGELYEEIHTHILGNASPENAVTPAGGGPDPAPSAGVSEKTGG